MTKRYSAAAVWRRLASALDEVEKGNAVIIERRGVQFRLVLDAGSPPRARTARGTIEIVDPAVRDGEWTWTWSARGLRFTGRSRR